MFKDNFREYNPIINVSIHAGIHITGKAIIAPHPTINLIARCPNLMLPKRGSAPPRAVPNIQIAASSLKIVFNISNQLNSPATRINDGE